MIDAKLFKLVSEPCNSPCSLAGICEEIMPCMAGPAKPPNEYGIIMAYIIQGWSAKV